MKKTLVIFFLILIFLCSIFVLKISKSGRTKSNEELSILNTVCIDSVLKLSYFDGFEAKYIDVQDKNNNFVRCK